MLKKYTMVCLWAGVTCAGCAGEETDQDVLDRLPAVALSRGVVEALSDCGDVVPEDGDLVTRLDGDAGTIVVLRNGHPFCAEHLRDWLAGGGEEVSKPEAEAPADTDPSPGQEPPPEDEMDSDQIAGPRPIPWMDDKDSDDK